MQVSYGELWQDDRIHRNAYVDPAVFAQEMHSIFSTVWVYVAHESEIREPGDYKTTRLGLNPVIVTRTPEGNVAVLFNRCAHRGLTVCQAKTGNAAFFRCAYHGWTYDSTGALVGAPYPKGYDAGFDKKQYGLAALSRVEQYRGFIFASLNPDVGDLREWLGGATKYLDAFEDASPTGKIEARSGAHKYFYKGNWKLQLEGSVDGYHPYLLHKSFFDIQNKHSGARSDMYNRETTTAYVVALGNGHSATDATQEFLDSNLFYERVRMSPSGPQLIAELAATQGEDGARALVSKTGGNGFNLALFPNLVLIQAQIRVILPLAHNRTNVEVYPTTLPGLPDKINQMRLRSHELFFGPAGFGSPDDLEAFNRTQAGLEAEPVEWMDFTRGRSREQHQGGDRIVGQITDETHQRGMYRQWAQLMTAGTAEAPRDGELVLR